jgi:hypothetical protein
VQSLSDRGQQALFSDSALGLALGTFSMFPPLSICVHLPIVKSSKNGRNDISVSAMRNFNQTKLDEDFGLDFQPVGQHQAWQVLVWIVDDVDQEAAFHDYLFSYYTVVNSVMPCPLRSAKTMTSMGAVGLSSQQTG